MALQNECNCFPVTRLDTVPALTEDRNKTALMSSKSRLARTTKQLQSTT